jgi:GTP cyclohydrolase II
MTKDKKRMMKKGIPVQRINKAHRMVKIQIKKRKITNGAEASANLPSRFGHFRVVAFYDKNESKESAAFIHGNVYGKQNVPVRLQSECVTGDVAGSIRCDCRDQLEKAFGMIGKRRYGVFIYLRQEGRGIGLFNKIRAYHLQDRGLDTVEANLALGFKEDYRNYAIAARIIKKLNLKSIELISNNPRKFEGLRRHGIKISKRLPIETVPRPENIKYLIAKRDKEGHMLHNLERYIKKRYSVAPKQAI